VGVPFPRFPLSLRFTYTAKKTFKFFLLSVWGAPILLNGAVCFGRSVAIGPGSCDCPGAGYIRQPVALRVKWRQKKRHYRRHLCAAHNSAFFRIIFPWYCLHVGQYNKFTWWGSVVMVPHSTHLMAGVLPTNVNTTVLL
jgi:hypothetical protein